VVALASFNPNTPDTPVAPTDRFTDCGTMRRRVTRAERAAIIQLYESGLSTRAVAERLQVSKSCVLNILKAEGVTMRPRGNPGSRALSS
jgi:transcriptional regulator of aromatic amino acid metabolism